MRNWKRRKLVINATVGTKSVLQFHAQEELPNIIKLTSSCGCSVPEYDPKTRILTVKYNPNAIPKHLIPRGSYTTTKNITVHYEGGSRDILSFTATVKDK